MRLSFAGLFSRMLKPFALQVARPQRKKESRALSTCFVQCASSFSTCNGHPARGQRSSTSADRKAARVRLHLQKRMKPPKSFKSPRPFRELRQNESRFIRRDSNTTKGDVSGLTLHIRHSDRMTSTLCAFFPLVIGFEQKKFLSKRKSSAFKPFLLFLFFNKNTNLEIAF